MFVLYDKINDLNKPAKRAIDKDQTKNQFDLFSRFKREKTRLEVLKMEVRLSSKAKMIEILEKVGLLNLQHSKIFLKKNCAKRYLNYIGKNSLEKTYFCLA